MTADTWGIIGHIVIAVMGYACGWWSRELDARSAATARKIAMDAWRAELAILINRRVNLTHQWARMEPGVRSVSLADQITVVEHMIDRHIKGVPQ